MTLHHASDGSQRISAWRGAALVVAIASGCVGLDPPDGEIEPDALLACVPDVHHLPGGIAIHGCADQAAAVRVLPGPEPLPDVDFESGIDTSVHVEPGKRLHDCEWSSFTDVAKVMMVTCPSGTHVVSGGCMSQTPMLVSAPWENNAVGDLPENAERYQDLGDPNGWLCIYEDPYPSGQIATALCCE